MDFHLTFLQLVMHSLMQKKIGRVVIVTFQFYENTSGISQNVAIGRITNSAFLPNAQYNAFASCVYGANHESTSTIITNAITISSDGTLVHSIGSGKIYSFQGMLMYFTS